MIKVRLPLCAALLLLPATAFAAPAADGSGLNDEGAKVTQVGETRLIEFGEGDSIEGETLRPEGAPVRGSRRGKLESMISIRTEFIPLLIKLSADI
jgi:hypothetical protein